MPSEISHTGVIVDITPEFTTVEIVSESACSSCHAASLCGMAESVRKAVQVPTTLGDWEVGQEVEVNLKATMGYKAVWLAYVVPLLALVCVMLLLNRAGLSDLYCGLGAIASVGVYYLVIWLLRGRLKNDYSFYIKRK